MGELLEKIEHPIYLGKNLFRHRKTRYQSLAKNTAQLLMLFGMANLIPSKKRFAAIDDQGASEQRKLANVAIKSLSRRRK